VDETETYGRESLFLQFLNRGARNWPCQLGPGCQCQMPHLETSTSSHQRSTATTQQLECTTHQKKIVATEEEANSVGGPNARGPSGIWSAHPKSPNPDPDPVARSRASSPGLDRSGGRRVRGISPRFGSGRTGGSLREPWRRRRRPPPPLPLRRARTTSRLGRSG
jgi:hypothetical protein